MIHIRGRGATAHNNNNNDKFIFAIKILQFLNIQFK